MELSGALVHLLNLRVVARMQNSLYTVNSGTCRAPTKIRIVDVVADTRRPPAMRALGIANEGIPRSAESPQEELQRKPGEHTYMPLFNAVVNTAMAAVGI